MLATSYSDEGDLELDNIYLSQDCDGQNNCQQLHVIQMCLGKIHTVHVAIEAHFYSALF